MLILKTLIAVLVTFQNTVGDELFQYETAPSNHFDLEMKDLLGFGHRPEKMKRHVGLDNSASQFLLEIYNEITEDDIVADDDYSKKMRHKRSIQNSNDGFITDLDRIEIAKSNNIITFSSKAPRENLNYQTKLSVDLGMLLNFNTNDVPRDLELLHSTLRLYQDPAFGIFHNKPTLNTTISVYKKVFNRKLKTNDFRLVTSINSTTEHKGWLELKITKLLQKWLIDKTLEEAINGNHLLITARVGLQGTVNIRELGIVEARPNDMIEFQSFIIGYFDGPELINKIQKLRFKRELMRRKSNMAYRRPPPPPIQPIYKLPKSCERLNFTLDFRDLHMHNWVIAPKKFEAYFCGGDCNFPLGSRMNATNHAIVQTLMHLKQPNLPKPCCVPTALGAISILHYLNEDSVNLSKYPQSVAKQCGCH